MKAVYWKGSHTINEINEALDCINFPRPRVTNPHMAIMCKELHYDKVRDELDPYFIYCCNGHSGRMKVATIPVCSEKESLIFIYFDKFEAIVVLDTSKMSMSETEIIKHLEMANIRPLGFPPSLDLDDYNEPSDEEKVYDGGLEETDHPCGCQCCEELESLRHLYDKAIGRLKELADDNAELRAENKRLRDVQCKLKELIK